MHFPIVHFFDVLPVISIKDGILSIDFHWKGPDAKFLHCMKFQDQGSSICQLAVVELFFWLVFLALTVLVLIVQAMASRSGLMVRNSSSISMMCRTPTRRMMLEELLKFEKDRLAPLTVKE